MKTRLHASVMALIVMSACALAQTDRWERVTYPQMGFSVNIPAGSTKRAAPAPEEGTLDLYVSGGMAITISTRPASDTELSSTVIEKSIQSEVKRFPELGPMRRWECNSDQGDLFKGCAGLVKLDPGDAFEADIGRIIGGTTAAKCSSMAPLGDDTAPVLCIGVFGPVSREKQVVAAAKAMAASVKRETSPPSANAAPPGAAKPWPALKKGEIEIEGVVESVAKDCKSIVLTAEFIKLPGQERIALYPPRTKQVRLRAKQDWIAAGGRVILIGKNTGVGKPMTADVIEAVKQ